MILTAKSIKRLGLVIPWCERTKLNGVSYGQSYAGYDIRVAEAVRLQIGHTTLTVSLERFKMPNNVLGVVHDKSTWARLGVQVQNTVIEPGWEGYLTLELSYSPLISQSYGYFDIQKGTGIAQVIFQYTEEETEGYEGKYQNAAQVAQGALFSE